MSEDKSAWTPSYSVTHLAGVNPKVETKDGLSASRDVPTVDGPVVMEVENPAINVTKTEAAKDDGPHYFPEVPESLDDAPER